ncbi:MAG: threonylcarbamoyladenosine tRNA methylthiotransferase [Candidatus Methanomethylophilaceae archaeon]|nr:threonylcarbamoyladenosine tRNA methylthiotransferase [Candidatus Methanomethylophilaceae archaeon]MDI3541721.1 threonylcarbamoyladenosine tRNA methylthiotransferase [Candidatus Methanomethylophilaceae archaeon]
MKKFYVESYGCTMNQGEGKFLFKELTNLGYTPCRSAEEADLVVLNTCTVVETTELRMLRRLSELRSQGKEMVLTGCMAKVQNEVLSASSPASLIIPPQEYDQFSEKISQRYGGSPKKVYIPSETTAILPISQGCMGSCTYCITRFARGSLHSFPEEQLLAEFQTMISSGVKEVLLTSQDIASYGKDRGSDICSLLELLLEEEGNFRIRLGMMNPEHAIPLKERLLDLMRDRRLYRFLHIPVQSGSDRILSHMGRRYSVADFVSFVEEVHRQYPEMSIATDMIVGFPGENEEDHILSLNLLEKIRPDIINITRFSPRPGTAAATMPDRPHGRISKARSREMAALHMRLGKMNNNLLVGNVEEVMVTEHGRGDTMISRTDSYKPVVIPAGPFLGQRLKVRLTAATPTHLFGEPVDSA